MAAWRGIPAKTMRRQSPVSVSQFQEQLALMGAQKAELPCVPHLKRIDR